MVRVLAKATCPNCNQPFNASLEQILDVEIDPSAKDRLLSGLVNVVGCPHCRMAGTVNVPFIYHDPSKELALVLMPLEAGHNNLEQQQLIGSLSRALMSQLPAERRRGYLLNPQVFFSLENLIDKVLEADGITPEMIQAQQAKADLLQRLLETPTPEARIDLIRENEALLDEESFQLLHVNMRQANAVGEEEMTQKMAELHTLLLEQTATGRQMAARAEALQALQEQPTREKLLELLVSSTDPETQAALITFGQPLVDYLFFQAITQRIETTKDKAEQQRLENLRQDLMDYREEMQEQAKRIVEARLVLLRNLMATEQPELLARRHMRELDELFFSTLAAETERAQKKGDTDRLAQLQEIWRTTTELLQRQMPPELALLTRLLKTKDTGEIQGILQANQRIVGRSFVQLLEQVEKQMREQEETETAERVAAILAMAKTMAQSQEQEEERDADQLATAKR